MPLFGRSDNDNGDRRDHSRQAQRAESDADRTRPTHRAVAAGARCNRGRYLSTGYWRGLQPARELGETVERLFGVEDEKEGRHLEARWYDDIADSKSSKRPRASLGRVGGKIVAVPQNAAGLSLSPVAGIVARRKGTRAEVVTYNS